VVARAWARLARARRPSADPAPGLLVVHLDAMPPEDRAAFAGGVPEARAAAIERQTGRRPGRGTTLVVVAVRPDGPR
jgi:hypothetical protein